MKKNVWNVYVTLLAIMIDLLNFDFLLHNCIYCIILLDIEFIYIFCSFSFVFLTNKDWCIYIYLLSCSMLQYVEIVKVHGSFEICFMSAPSYSIVYRRLCWTPTYEEKKQYLLNECKTEKRWLRPCQCKNRAINMYL